MRRTSASRRRSLSLLTGLLRLSSSIADTSRSDFLSRPWCPCRATEQGQSSWQEQEIIPGSGLPEQVSESIIQFPRVKPVAGPDRPDMES